MKIFVGLGQDWCNYTKLCFEVMIILKISVIKLIVLLYYCNVIIFTGPSAYLFFNNDFDNKKIFKMFCAEMYHTCNMILWEH
jgi:hypothetical protein